jgi:hypothetical protein
MKLRREKRSAVSSVITSTPYDRTSWTAGSG